MKRLGIWILGVLLILLGIAGLFLPILQGWLFIFLGLSLIAPRFARRLRNRLFRKFFKSDLIYLEEWKKTGVEAGFTTRRFPLEVKSTSELAQAARQESFIRLFSQSAVARSHRLRVPTKCVLLRQVHGCAVRVLEDASAFSEDGFYPMAESDGAVTNIPGLTILVLSADCLPIFFVCGDWVGLAHAGWRGTRDRIAGQMTRLLRERTGLHPRHIRVFFGPCISAAHYEVGPEFRDFFRPSSLREKGGRLYFDLARENETQLVRAGVKRRCILNRDICTFSENGSFYSFRKEGEKAGRTVSFITKV